MTESSLDSYGKRTADQLAHVAASMIDEQVAFTIEQIITDAGEIVGHYHLVLGSGAATVHPGAAPNPDITIKQDAETAEALRDGTLHAQGAFLTGRLSVDGDVAKLIEYGPLLTSLLAAQPQG